MRRISVTLAGLLILAIGGWRPGSVDGTSCPTSEVMVSEPQLLALERDNGCTDDGLEPAQGVWPDWRSATVAGGDVPPTRVGSDPYPTLHSVAVDAQHGRVFMSDPNRHALWSFERLATSKGRGAVTPLTSIRRASARN